MAGGCAPYDRDVDPLAAGLLGAFVGALVGALAVALGVRHRIPDAPTPADLPPEDLAVIAASVRSAVAVIGPADELVAHNDAARGLGIVNGTRLAIPAVHELVRGVRVDGEAWPTCQDMAAPDDDGFTVTYYRGAAPNILTRAAAGALAAEFYEACQGNACRLPSNITSMSRSGESYDFQQTDLPEGDLGIPEVNAVIAIYNPYRLKSAPKVVSPDSQNAMVPTWN